MADTRAPAESESESESESDRRTAAETARSQLSDSPSAVCEVRGFAAAVVEGGMEECLE